MRTLPLTALGVTAVLAVGCTRTVVPRNPPAQPAPAPPPPRPHPASTLGIPPGHLPHPGECRIWIPQVPPGRQRYERSRACRGIAQGAPAGSWIVYRPEQDTRHVHVWVVDQHRAGVVMRVRVFEAERGNFVREELPPCDLAPPNAPCKRRDVAVRPEIQRPQEERPPAQPERPEPRRRRPTEPEPPAAKPDRPREEGPGRPVPQRPPSEPDVPDANRPRDEQPGKPGRPLPQRPPTEPEPPAPGRPHVEQPAKPGRPVPQRPPNEPKTPESNRPGVEQPGKPGRPVPQRPPEKRGADEPAQPEQPAGPAKLGIPPGQLPKAGECRIWIPAVPAGRQSSPSQSCQGIAQRAPAGSWVVVRPVNDRQHVHVRVVDPRRPGVVVAVRVFDAQNGRFVREEKP